jgi:hypothetical protein
MTLHDGGRVWKELDWDLMDLLHEKGWIVDPQSKAKSVVLTEDGERRAAEFLRKRLELEPLAPEVTRHHQVRETRS